MKTELNADQMMCLRLFRGYRNVAKVAKAMNVTKKEMQAYLDETFQTVFREMGIEDATIYHTPRSRSELIQSFFDKLNPPAWER